MSGSIASWIHVQKLPENFYLFFQGKDVNSSVGCYWKQMSVVLVASIFLFVYEFCERYLKRICSPWAAGGVAVHF